LDRTVNFGLILFGLGVIVLFGYWIYFVVVVSDISFGIKLGVSGMLIGGSVILYSVMRDRLKEVSSEDVSREQ
jgi:hypothetical protein